MRVLLFLALAAVVGFPSATEAHELAESSATLVVRSGGHLELRLQLPYSELLRRQWMPRATMHEFLRDAANMSEQRFARQLAQLHGALERDLRVIVDGKSTTLGNWTWPAADTVRRALRTHLMATLAEPGRHDHGERVPALGHAVVRGDPSALRLFVPAALGPTLLTVYRPQEQWVRPGSLSNPVSVRRP